MNSLVEVKTKFNEVLDSVKKKELDLSNLAILIDNTPALKFLSLWSKIPIIYDFNFENELPENESDYWDWLWSNVTINLDDFCSAIGHSEETTDHVFEQLKLAHLILPDGSYPRNVKTYLDKLVLTTLMSTEGYRPRK